MTNIVWTGGSGSWGTGSDWSTGAPPTDLDTVQIDTPQITVTVGAGVAATAYSLSTVGSTLSITGGTLTTIAGATFGGAFLESSGLFVTGGAGATFNDSIDMSGGTIEALAGAALNVDDGGILAGALTGTGQLDINGGTTYINAGFSSSLSSIVVNALLGFDTNFVTKSNFTVLNGGDVDLFGHKLTIAGNATIDGVIGNGTLLDAGTLTLGTPNGTQYLDNGLTLSVTGSVIQSGQVDQGTSDAGAKIAIGKTGHYAINGNWTIYDPSSVGTITNAGIFAKTGGGKTAQINTSFSNSGTIQAGIGTLLLNGLVNTLNGSVTGAGTLAVAGGQTVLGTKLSLTEAGFDQQGGILVLNKGLAYAGQWGMTGGVLNLNSAASRLTLSGQSNFDGGTITGYGGTMTLSGTTQMGNMLIGGPNTLTISGKLDQTNTITFGPSSNPTADILKGASWSIEGDSSIQGAFGLIDNQGSFIDPNGSGTAQVDSEFESTGTVTVNNATLQFSGPTLLGGTITGNGLLDLAGATTLESGVGIGVAALDINNAIVLLDGNISYANSFSETGNLATLDLGGYSFALTGTVSLDDGTATDSGTLAASGAVTIETYTIANGAILSIASQAEQTGQLTMNGGTLAIAAGATYTLDDDVSIAGTGVIDLTGSLLATGTVNSAISAALIQTGTLTVDDQSLTLAASSSLDGAIAGTGTLSLYGAAFTLGSGLAASVAAIDLQGNASIILAANDKYAGSFIGDGTIGLGNNTLSLTGTTLLSGATLNGPGFLADSGSTTLTNLSVLNGATLDLTGTVVQVAGNTTVTAASLTIGATGSYTLDENQSISGGGTLNVAGALTAGSDGTSSLAVLVNDTGVISANLGTLNVQGNVSGNGGFSIAAGAVLEFGNANSTITSATSVAFAGLHADLIIGDMAGFGAVLSDFASTDVIEITGINANSVQGTLLSGGLQYQVSDSNHDTVTLTFTTQQNVNSLYVGVAPDGNAAVFHH
jgi:hypothetical protein